MLKNIAPMFNETVFTLLCLKGTKIMSFFCKCMSLSFETAYCGMLFCLVHQLNLFLAIHLLNSWNIFMYGFIDWVIDVKPSALSLYIINYYYVFILSAISPYTTGFKALFNQSNCTGTAPTHK